MNGEKANGAVPSHKDSPANSPSPAPSKSPVLAAQRSANRRGAATISHGRVSARVWTSSIEVDRVVRRAVPRRGREYDHVAKAHVIYGSRVRSLLDAFAAAGVTVTELGEPA